MSQETKKSFFHKPFVYSLAGCALGMVISACAGNAYSGLRQLSSGGWGISPSHSGYTWIACQDGEGNLDPLKRPVVAQYVEVEQESAGKTQSGVIVCQ
ncbi:MAG: hypothetical protein ACOYK8_02565 [Alphaproteobacteria bacterium]